MDARIFTAEASVIVGRAERNGERAPTSKRALLLQGRDRLGGPGCVRPLYSVYDEDAHLLDAVSRFTGTGLEAGEAVVVITTPPHRDYLEARFRAHGVDLATMGARGQYSRWMQQRR